MSSLVSEVRTVPRKRRNHLQIRKILKHLENRLDGVNEAEKAEFLCFAQTIQEHRSAVVPEEASRKGVHT